MSIKIFNRYGQDLQEIVDNNIEILRYYFDKNRRISFASTNDYSIHPEEPAVRMLSDIRYKPPVSQRKEQQKLIQQRIQEEKAMQSAPTAPIDATKFVAYVTERRKKRILFKGEYLMILRSVDPLKCQWNVASSQGDKNQYADTLPYDHSRVVLSKKPTDENSHYINASYVPSWLREKTYVVTQAVKSKAATNEFWRMIWELRANTIVMLTKVFDFMRVMCLQYWPVSVFTYGEIIVETLETKTYAHFVIRTFKLKNANSEEERIVKHFHFTEWELNSFPYISAFIELRRRVRQWTEKNPIDAPIVVHCS
uniref:Tyrosine-protein phosphatase domain-containing protein n=1 Tax=Panagrolaimus sp. PS1159 TaxID=55785 RepID=A0AC35G4R9_9BILA